MTTDSRSAGPRPAGWPVAGWIVLAVVAVHALAFWALADKHFLPRTAYLPPPPAANFGARQQTRVDPQTGELTTESEFVVSTHFASPPPASQPEARR